MRDADKHNALVSLAKILGFMQPARVTVSAPAGGPVQLLGLTPDELRAEAALIIGNIEEEAIEAELVDEEAQSHWRPKEHGERMAATRTHGRSQP